MGFPYDVSFLGLLKSEYDKSLAVKLIYIEEESNNKLLGVYEGHELHKTYEEKARDLARQRENICWEIDKIRKEISRYLDNLPAAEW